MSFFFWLAWVPCDVQKPRKKFFALNRLALCSFLEERRVLLFERGAILWRRSNKKLSTSSTTYTSLDKSFFTCHLTMRCASYHSLLSSQHVRCSFLSSCSFNSPLSHISFKISYTRIVPKSFFFPFLPSDCPSTATSLGEQEECSTGNASTCVKKGSIPT